MMNSNAISCFVFNNNNCDEPHMYSDSTQEESMKQKNI